MTFGELIRIIKNAGKISGTLDDFVIDLFEVSFGFDRGSTCLTSDRVKKWLQRQNSGVNKWIYDAIKEGKVFDHASFIDFLSCRTTMTWLAVQIEFSKIAEAERPMIDCTTEDSSVFWRSVLWQFKGIVGLAQNDDNSPMPISESESVTPSENLPRLVAAPFLFSPINTKRNNSVTIYKSGNRDKSTVIMSGKFEDGNFLVISYGKVFVQHSISLYDVQGGMVETLYPLLSAIGGGYPNKRIGISSGHGEQLTAAGFNRTLKSKLADDGISISDTVVAAIKVCDVFIIGEPLIEYSEDEEDEIISFIANGGAVVFCSNGWTLRKGENSEKGEIEYLPVNRFGKTLGFKIDKGITGNFLCIGDKRLYFSPLQNAAGQNEKSDYSEEISRLIAMAVDGDSNAQWQLGMKYEIGKEIPKDGFSALYWYKMSAFSGNANGQHRLSRCYMGAVLQGVKQNNALVFLWLTASAEQGNKYAQGNLGHAYLCGSYGIAIDKEKAIMLIEASAKNGWAVSQIRLGKHCEELQDYNNAALWYTRAANNKQISPDDLAEAKLCLGLLFKSGKGVSRDVKKALLLLRESAKCGNDTATAELDILENDLLSNTDITDLDDGNTKYYDTKIFDGTKYAEFTEDEKRNLLEAVEAEFEIRIGECLGKYVGEEKIAEFDKIFEDMDFVDSEIERLNVKQSYFFKANRLRLPQSITDLEVARDVFSGFWLQHHCPDYLPLIQEQRMLILKELLNGTLDLECSESSSRKNTALADCP